MLTAPAAHRFPDYPASWYLLGSSLAMRGRPMGATLFGRPLVGFRTSTGKAVVLDARCAHLGTDLTQGKVVGQTLECPFHNWRYGPDGRCVHIPASTCIPEFARLGSYPTVERHGYVFVFNGPEPLFPLPFFPNVDPDGFLASEPFEATLACPWWMVGANVFDLQHFRAAHDRKMVGSPHVDCPSPHARRISADFTVLGDTLRDRLVRWLAGDRVRMTFVDWCGNIIFATPTFRRTTSYGMLITNPLGRERVQVRGLVFVPRSQGRLGQMLFDPIHVRIRRQFIKAFLQSDARLGTKGLTYNPAGLFECDRELIHYFDWLASLPGTSAEKSLGEPRTG